MNILRINNQYNCIERPSIQSQDLSQWFLDGKLHRSMKPAVETKYTQRYFWRGILINKQISEGKLTPQEILRIDNMEVRQSAMEILGYEKFFNCSKEIHRFTPLQFEKKFPIQTNPMYSLFILDTNKDELNDDIKILMMNDPSKFPFVKYFIRVHPDELDCRLAVAHSYNYLTWEEFIENKEWR